VHNCMTVRYGCAGGRGAGTGGWPTRGDASVPLPRRPAPAPTRLARALRKTLSLRERPYTLPGGPVSEEMRSLLLQPARSSRDGSHFLQPVFVYMTTCNQQDQRILFRPETCLEMGLANDAARLRTASVRQDQRKYCVLVLRTHPVGSVVRRYTLWTLRSLYR